MVTATRYQDFFKLRICNFTEVYLTNTVSMNFSIMTMGKGGQTANISFTGVVSMTTVQGKADPLHFGLSILQSKRSVCSSSLTYSEYNDLVPVVLSEIFQFSVF